MSTNALIAYILTGLIEQATPNGHLYVHVMGKTTITRWQAVVDVLKHNKLIEEAHHLLSLTDAGRKLALEVDEKLKEVESKTKAEA